MQGDIVILAGKGEHFSSVDDGGGKLCGHPDPQFFKIHKLSSIEFNDLKFYDGKNALSRLFGKASLENGEGM